MELVAAHCVVSGVPLRVADFNEIESVSDSREGQVFRYRGGQELSVTLLGEHQLRNAAVVLETVEALRGRGWKIGAAAVAEGLAGTRWPARFELVCRDPYFVVDGGHNPQCAETVAGSLRRYFPGWRRVLLLGVLGDKDYRSLCDILEPCADEFVTITPESPRALPAETLAEHLRTYGKPVTACGSIAEGAETAKERAKAVGGMAVSVGSLYTAGTVRAAFGLY
jgi:dihydrofolate synthase/folylpolyglutamate synthase